MIISNDVRRALMRCISDMGTQRAFAANVGVSPSTVGDWVNGKAANIRHAHWMKVEPLLLEYLPEQYRLSAKVTAQAMDGASAIRRQCDSMDRQKFTHIREQSRHVPVMDSATAAGYTPAVDTLGDYLQGQEIETHMFAVGVSPAAFALRIDEHTMGSQMPKGTLLLLDPDKQPRTGSVVVARLADLSTVICKRYHRIGGVVRLESVNEDGDDYEIDIRTDPARIVWMYQTVVAELDLGKPRQTSDAPQPTTPATPRNGQESNPPRST